MTANLPMIPPPCAGRVSLALRVMAYQEHLKARAAQKQGQPLMASHHFRASEDYQASAKRLCSSPISDLRSPIPTP